MFGPVTISSRPRSSSVAAQPQSFGTMSPPGSIASEHRVAPPDDRQLVVVRERGPAPAAIGRHVRERRQHVQIRHRLDLREHRPGLLADACRSSAWNSSPSSSSTRASAVRISASRSFSSGVTNRSAETSDCRR